MLPRFYQDTIFFFIPYYGNNNNPCYNNTLGKERELSLLPSSTVNLPDKATSRARRQVVQVSKNIRFQLLLDNNYILIQLKSRRLQWNE